MKKKTKKIVAVFLTLAIILSMSFSTAFANEGGVDASADGSAAAEEIWADDAIVIESIENITDDAEEPGDIITDAEDTDLPEDVISEDDTDLQDPQEEADEDIYVDIEDLEEVDDADPDEIITNEIIEDAAEAVEDTAANTEADEYIEKEKADEPEKQSDPKEEKNEDGIEAQDAETYSLIITREGTCSFSGEFSLKGDDWQICMTNSTTETKKVVLDYTLSGGDTDSCTMTLPENHSVYSLAPGASKTIVFGAAPTSSYQLDRQFYVNGTLTITKSYNISEVYASPVTAKAGTTYVGNGKTGYPSMSDPTYQDRYYSMTLSKDSAVKISYTGEAASEIGICRTGLTLKTPNCTQLSNGKAYILSAGTYIIQVRPASNAADKEYQFRYDVEDINWGSLKVLFNDSTKTTFTAGSQVSYSYSYTKGSNFGTANSVSTTGISATKDMGNNTINASAPGKYYVKVSYSIKANKESYKTPVKTFTKTMTVKPAKAAKSGDITGSYNSITIPVKSNEKYGDTFIIQQKSGTSWVKVKTAANKCSGSQNIKISNLKANKTYYFRVIGYDSKNKLKGTASSSIKAKTCVSTKPVIKSASCSGAKVSSSQVWQKGYWIGDTYYPGKYVTVSGTTYTVKITLSKAVSGTSGMYIQVLNSKGQPVDEDGIYVKGTGKTFTFQFTEDGKKVIGSARYLRVQPCSSANTNIRGKYSDKKAATVR
ncbi:MAG: hypothetical protein HUJ73_00215 [Eubacterium sp.]|nr:hypothetical protein [Eubacterium sp.]